MSAMAISLITIVFIFLMMLFDQVIVIYGASLAIIWVIILIFSFELEKIRKKEIREIS